MENENGKWEWKMRMENENGKWEWKRGTENENGRWEWKMRIEDDGIFQVFPIISIFLLEFSKFLEILSI